MSKRTAWPAEKADMMPLASLTPNARNPRVHSAQQIDQIASAIKEWGFTTAILVDESHTILAGHGRYAAAQKLGLEQVPVMVAAGWSDAKKRAYVIADNKIALNSAWDDELLNIELESLKDEGFDVDLTGFEDFGNDEIEPMDIGEPTNQAKEYSILIDCQNEKEQEKLFDELEKRGFDCKILN